MTRLALLLLALLAGCSLALLAFLLLLAGCSAQPAGNATPSGGPQPQDATLRGAPQTPYRESRDPLRRATSSSAPTALSGAPTLTPEVLAGGTTPISGTASWYAARGDQGAVPWWRPGQDPVLAVVSRFADGRTRSVTVWITGFCQCLVGTDRERVIDLSDGAFRQLAPLSVGLIRVTVELSDAGPGLPATDLEGP